MDATRRKADFWNFYFTQMAILDKASLRRSSYNGRPVAPTRPITTAMTHKASREDPVVTIIVKGAENQLYLILHAPLDWNHIASPLLSYTYETTDTCTIYNLTAVGRIKRCCSCSCSSDAAGSQICLRSSV